VLRLPVPYNFQAVGQFYEKFEQVSDQEAIALLEENTILEQRLKTGLFTS
jgi:predicted phosphoribosyltransferase